MAQSPCFYIFYGDDEFSQQETLREFKARLGDPGAVEMNTTVLDGRTARLNELLHACNSYPFLADKRLVIVTGLIERLSGKDQQAEREALLDYLPQIPATTRLVLLESKMLPANNPFIQLASSSPAGYVRVFEVPQGRALEQWISQRATYHGVSIEPQAAALLAANVGDSHSLRLLDMEIGKLLSYVGLARPICPADIELLTPYVAQVGIFDLVDAIGQRRGQVAAALLRRKLEAGEDPLYLLAMIVRQFRLLIQVKEKAEQGYRPDDIARLVKQHPYTIGKIYQQAASFSLPQLEATYRHLLDTDLAIKTGQLDPAVALEVLVVELTG